MNDRLYVSKMHYPPSLLLKDLEKYWGIQNRLLRTQCHGMLIYNWEGCSDIHWEERAQNRCNGFHGNAIQGPTFLYMHLNCMYVQRGGALITHLATHLPSAENCWRKMEGDYYGGKNVTRWNCEENSSWNSCPIQHQIKEKNILTYMK